MVVDIYRGLVLGQQMLSTTGRKRTELAPPHWQGEAERHEIVALCALDVAYVEGDVRRHHG